MSDPIDPAATIKKVAGLRRYFNKTLILVGATVFIIMSEFMCGTGGLVEVEPGEAAVIYNNTGLGVFGEEARTFVEQGVKSFLPGLQTVLKLERRPQILVMGERGAEGGGSVDTVGSKSIRHVKPLTVRANDGSNFYFGRLEIHYQISAALARTVIETSGPGDAYKQELLATYAREVMRDAFGRYSFLEIADPTTYGKATTEARRLLNEQLEAYGLEVTQIITPKPKFDGRVEKAIEDRQNAEQEVEVQEEKRRKLEQEAGLKVQAVEQEKNAEYQSLIAELEANKKAASNQLLSVRREADKYYIEKNAGGAAYRDEKVTRAKANEVAYRKEAEGLVAKITAVGAQGPDVLNSVIAKKVMPQLERVTATPLVQPAYPLDIRHISKEVK